MTSYIGFVSETRLGKVMRRILRKIAPREIENLGDHLNDRRL